MKKITRLTQAQIEAMPRYDEEWTKIGLCTDPADRPRAEAGIRLVYELAGLKPPEKIVWCGSPFSIALTYGLVRGSVRDSVRDSVWRSVRESVHDSVRNSVRDSVCDSVRDSVAVRVRDSVWDIKVRVRDSILDSVRKSVWDSVGVRVRDSVGDSVRDSVWRSVRDSVWDSVRDSVGDSVAVSVRESVWRSVGALVSGSVRDNVAVSVEDSVGDSVRERVWRSVGVRARDSIWECGYGQHDANWLAFYRFFRDECGLVAETNRLDGLVEIAQSAGWFLPCEHICFVSERHNIVRLGEQGRIHCETGPAIQYPDGWGIYAWHGVRVPAHWIEDRANLDPREVIREENVERRAVGAAIVGWPKMLDVLEAKVIDDSGSDDIGQLIELTLPGLSQPGRFLKARCPRNGIIVEGVPYISDIDGLPIETAIAAQAWRIGDPQSEYQHPTKRT